MSCMEQGGGEGWAARATNQRPHPLVQQLVHHHCTLEPGIDTCTRLLRAPGNYVCFLLPRKSLM